MAGLIETRLAGEGGYTLFWKGKAETKDRIHGVGFANRTALFQQIPDVPTGITEHFMKLYFPLAPSRYITIISTYAPTLQSCEEDKEAFYENLDSLVKNTPLCDTLLVLGDFNASVGQD